MSQIRSQSKIFIAGHRGLVGSALVRIFKDQGYQNLILRTRDECNLESREQVRGLIQKEKPDCIILAAAKVGGIWANQNLPYDFIQKNLDIQMNIIHEAHLADVPNLVFLGSSCIYPKMAEQPLRESSLLTGPLEPTNRPYALAKIAGIEMCWALNRQMGRRYFSVMPTNMYGIEDNFDLKTSHVLPALIRKIHEAKINKEKSVEIWGSGRPLREFLYSDDLARGILFLLEQDQSQLSFLFSSESPPLINIGSGSEITILELAKLIKKIVQFEGDIKFDSSQPDGTPRKLMDSSKIQALGWRSQINLEQGIRQVYEAKFAALAN